MMELKREQIYMAEVLIGKKRKEEEGEGILTASRNT